MGVTGVAPIELRAGTWDWSRPYLLGVLNVTPDSFSDGGRYSDPSAAVAHAHAMIAEGADAIDVGGESTRPGAAPVPIAEELRRVVPVIEALARAVSVPISVDTCHAEVARAALGLGACIVNDVGIGDDTAALAGIAAEYGAAYIAMHSGGARESLEARAAVRYDDVVADVRDSLRERRDVAVAAGLPQSHVILDPGIGFAKIAADSIAVLANLDALHALGQPLCVGPSRKSFIVDGAAYGPSWGEVEAREASRVGGTAAAVALAVSCGAHLLRVHDVGVMRQAARVAHGLSTARRRR